MVAHKLSCSLIFILFVVYWVFIVKPSVDMTLYIWKMSELIFAICIFFFINPPLPQMFQWLSCSFSCYQTYSKCTRRIIK